jgi:hypothetical protein
MASILKQGILLVSISIALFVPHLSAQQPTPEPPAAPVPSPILRAKRVFIVNAEGDNDPRIAKYIGGPEGLYNQFYADVKNSGRFEVVAAPADADVVLEVTFTVFAVIPGYPRLRLAILDPKSNVLLWTISEPVDPAILAKNARRNIAQALAKLTQDLTTLTPKQ